MSMVKGAGLAGVPSLFLPANVNESRMSHTASPGLLLTEGDSTPQQHTEAEERCAFKGLQCYSTHTLYCMNTVVKAHQGRCQKVRVVGGS